MTQKVELFWESYPNPNHSSENSEVVMMLLEARNTSIEKMVHGWEAPTCQELNGENKPVTP